MRRPDQARTAMTATTTTRARVRTIRERSIIGSGPSKDAALVELGAEKAEGAEVEAGVEGHHHNDRDRDHPRNHRVDGQEQRGQQPDAAAEDAGDASRLVVLVDVVALQHAGGLEGTPW